MSHEASSCCDPAVPCAQPCERLAEFWDPQLLLELSHHSAVERCHALGELPVNGHDPDMKSCMTLNNNGATEVCRTTPRWSAATR